MLGLSTRVLRCTAPALRAVCEAARRAGGARYRRAGRARYRRARDGIAWITTLLFHLALAALVAEPAALAGVQSDILLNQIFHGPGSRGFLPTCTAPFSVTNNATYSQAFSSWTAENSGSSNPTVASGQTAPDNSTNAYQVSFPAVSGSSHYSVLNLATSLAAYYPYTFGVWAQVVSGGSNGTIWATQTHSTTFARAAIPNDGNWHLVQATSATGAFTSGGQSLQIGVNLNDSGQSAITGTVVVNLWNAFAIPYPISQYVTSANISGPLKTTGSTVTATLTIPCPPGVAFRDFRPSLPAAGLQPLRNNPIITANPNELYEAGGVSGPYSNSALFANGYWWAFVAATSTVVHTDWMSFALYKSRDGINWIEDTANAPYLQAYGSNFASPAVSTAGSGYGAGITGATATYTNSGNCPAPIQLSVNTTPGGGLSSVSYVSGVCKQGDWPTAVSGSGWSFSGGLSAGSSGVIAWSSVHGTGSGPSYWQLHPAWLPYGCNVAGTAYPFCIVFGANNSSGNAASYLAYSPTVDGVYTLYGCSSGTCASPSPTALILESGESGAPSGEIKNQLPTVVNVGGVNGVNFIFTSTNANNYGGPYTTVWCTPANPNTTSGPCTMNGQNLGASTALAAGAGLNFLNTALPPKVSGVDWDYTSTNNDYADNFVFKNNCGFYEYFYTAPGASWFGSGAGQVIGYAVSNAPIGPWWKYGAIIPPVSTTYNSVSSLYGGTNDLGDSALIVVNNLFIWNGNYDNGTNASNGVSAVMPDACTY